MSVENPKEITFGEVRRVYGKAKEKPKKFSDLIIVKLSQPESQKVKSINRVLSTLYAHHKLNTKTLKEKSRLHWNTLERVIKPLIEKRILLIHQRKGRKNNEKIYSMDNERGVFYYAQLTRAKNRKVLARKIKNIPLRLVRLYHEDENIELTIPMRMQDKYEISLQRSTINDMPYQLAAEIILKRVNGFYCDECFERGSLQELVRQDDMEVCTNCHTEYPIEATQVSPQTRYLNRE